MSPDTTSLMKFSKWGPPLRSSFTLASGDKNSSKKLAVEVDSATRMTHRSCSDWCKALFFIRLSHLRREFG